MERIAIFGTGEGYFGGTLARAGEDVVFIARGDHLRAIGGERIACLQRRTYAFVTPMIDA